jgi:beta-glucosidase
MRNVKEPKGAGEKKEPLLFMDPAAPLEARADDLVSRLSLDEKIGMMASRQEAVPRLGIGEFHIGGEAAHGLVTKDGPTTVFPQTIGLACTWDAELLHEIGSTVGDEARAYHRKRKGLGGLCLWAPTIDMERDPRWGRTEEGYGEDPFLAAELSCAYVRGMQGGHPSYMKCVPTPKHFYANNNEEDRASCSASIEPRDKMEYYLRPYERAVADAGVRSIMTSYNAINGVAAMLHPDLARIVRGSWGLDGFMVCDGGALPLLVERQCAAPDMATAAALSLRAGIDSFSDDAVKVKAAIRGALERGLIAEADLDAALARVMRIRLRLGNFDPPGLDPFARLGDSTLWRKESRALALRAARESIVLLERRAVDGEQVLPLAPEEGEAVAILGPLADVVYRDWYSGTPAYRVTPLQALCDRLSCASVLYSDGSDVVALRAPDGRWAGSLAWYDATFAAVRPPEQGGELMRRTDWGWGNQTFRSLSSGCYLTVEGDRLSVSAREVFDWYVKERFSLEPAPDRRFSIRAWDGKPVALDAEGRLVVAEGAEPAAFGVEIVHDGLEEAVAAARAARTAIVFVGNQPVLVAKEEFDRSDIGLPPEQVRLIEAVIEANPRTVVVIVGSYPFALGPWRKRAAAVLYMAHGGQEAGHAIADVIMGDHNPAGRLPMTWYASADDLPGIKDYSIAKGGRTYQYFRGEPIYPFGHGLSYSVFEYLSAETDARLVKKGGKLRFTVRVKNAGPYGGEEVVQAYASFPGSAMRRPIRKLVGARRIRVEAGGTAEARIDIDSRDLEAWDQRRGEWILEKGRIELRFGGSSGLAGEHGPGLRAAVEVEGEPLPPRDPGLAIKADSFDDSEGCLIYDGDEPPSVRPVSAASEAWTRYEDFSFRAGEPVGIEVLLKTEGEGASIGFCSGRGRPIESVPLLDGIMRDWEWKRFPLSWKRGESTLSVFLKGDVRVKSIRMIF